MASCNGRIGLAEQHAMSHDLLMAHRILAYKVHYHTSSKDMIIDEELRECRRSEAACANRRGARKRRAGHDAWPTMSSLLSSSSHFRFDHGCFLAVVRMVAFGLVAGAVHTVAAGH